MMLARSFTPPTFPKTTSQRKKTCDRLFLAQFRADRATAVSDIIVRVAAEDLRQKAAAGAHGMSVYVWSAFLHRANIALNV